MNARRGFTGLGFNAVHVYRGGVVPNLVVWDQFRTSESVKERIFNVIVNFEVVFTLNTLLINIDITVENGYRF